MQNASSKVNMNTLRMVWHYVRDTVMNIFRRRESDDERDWGGLPRDIMDIIFSKLDTADILFSAQFVSTYWLQLSKQPHLFETIHLPDRTSRRDGAGLLEEAVDRSRGNLREISLGEPWCTDEILIYVSHHKPNALSSLRLANCRPLSRFVLIEAFYQLPFLVNLELFNAAHIEDPVHLIRQIGRSCRCLEYFRFDHMVTPTDKREYYFNNIASTIGRNMPHLHGLWLRLTRLTRKGLQHILNGCPNLQDLDLHYCYCPDLNKALRTELVRRLRNVRLPSSVPQYQWIHTEIDKRPKNVLVVQRTFKELNPVSHIQPVNRGIWRLSFAKIQGHYVPPTTCFVCGGSNPCLCDSEDELG